jgi:hypothetical protein
MTAMRIATTLAAAAAALGGVAAAAVPSSSPSRTVPCVEAIDETVFPSVGGQYRTVLGAVSVPPRFLAQIEDTGEHPWRYWRKAGLVVRTSGQPVTISVPPAWHGRAGIMWGNGGHGVMRSVRIAGCFVSPAVGYAYAGGFVLRDPSACLPLRFTVGGRTATVRFGLGRRCRS